MIKKFKIFESPDHLVTKDGKYIDWTSDDAYTFGYFNDRMIVSKRAGISHIELKADDTDDETLQPVYDNMSDDEKASFISFFIPSITKSEAVEFVKKYSSYDKIPEKYLKILKYHYSNYIEEGRNVLKYSGRLWKNHKYITFWDFPKDYDELWDVLNDLMKAFKEKGMDIKITDDWYIEVVTDDEGNQIENTYKYWGDSEIEGSPEGYTDKSKIIKIKDYMGSNKYSEKERQVHLLSWAEKQELKKKGWGKGWGSDLTAWDSKNPLWWRQAKYQENYSYLFENNAQFYYKKELNPKFWIGDMFNDRIRQKLLAIAYEFYSNFNFDAPIIDVVLVGSLANYNWNENSDLDVHIIIDFSKINSNTELVKKMVDDERQLWNLKHHIKIKGHDVELYVQDVNEKNISSGIYSLLRNEWINKPSWNKPKIDEKEIDFKYLTYKSGIDRLEEISKMKLTPELANKYYLYAYKLKTKIHDNRKIGLEKSGEFSIENLVFKKLRNNGDFGRLLDTINRLYDKIYTQ